jgi:hypothetical protein
MTDTNPGCWPDAARPGVPMNSEQFRAHRIRWYGDEQDWLWHPERRVWIGRLAVHYSALDVGLTRGAVYLGPCHTPAEVAALVEAARREGEIGAFAAGARSMRTTIEIAISQAARDEEVAIAERLRARGAA